MSFSPHNKFPTCYLLVVSSFGGHFQTSPPPPNPYGILRNKGRGELLILTLRSEKIWLFTQQG